jgi:hypothetical protein
MGTNPWYQVHTGLRAVFVLAPSSLFCECVGAEVLFEKPAHRPLAPDRILLCLRITAGVGDSQFALGYFSGLFEAHGDWIADLHPAVPATVRITHEVPGRSAGLYAKGHARDFEVEI